MKDQHGNQVPDDLVLLDNSLIDELVRSQLEAISKIDWYKPVKETKSILVSAQALDKAVGENQLVDLYDPVDMGIDISAGVNKIDDVLKRWNETDGFYHA